MIAAVAVQRDGKVLAGGDFTVINGQDRRLLVRMNVDGSMDEGFNHTVTTSTTGVAAIVVQPDGKIVIAGSLQAGDNQSQVIRLNTDGSTDTSFNHPGFSPFPSSAGRALALQPDGKILVAITARYAGGQQRTGVARLNADGSLDTSFQDPDAASLNLVNAIALQPDGRIVIGGRFTTVGGAPRNGIARLNANGALDSSFNPGGGADDTVQTVQVQPDGKVVIGGQFTSFNGTPRARIARLHADGSLDDSFVASADSDVLMLTPHQQDYLLVAGTFGEINGTAREGLARLHSSSAIPTPHNLLNISTRLRVQRGENALIGGFILTGSEPKRVIVRAIGPSLANAGVEGALQDMTLDLFNAAGEIIASNDDWKHTQQSELEATTIPPDDDRESAIVTTLTANNASYTAVVRGKSDATGIGLVEVYDLAQSADSKLANISTRGFVETGEQVMIGGFIAGGGNGSARVVVRAIGPSLANAGVAGALQDPTLQLVDANGSEIRANDDWKESQQGELEALQIAPGSDYESALVVTLSGGNYTAVVRGKDGGTGVGLVEVYNVP